MQAKYRFLLFFSLSMVMAAAAAGQNRYEGYSFTVEADLTGACPIRYMSSAGNGNAVSVYLAGTNQRIPATGLTPCGGGDVREGNKVIANGDGHWCFDAKEDLYDIKLTSGVTYLWYPMTKDSGVYNVKDFRPVTRGTGPTPSYTFTEPADYTRTIKNAIAFIAAREGGTLRFPDGDYIVGTTDGNTRDPNYQAITLPPGIRVVGAAPATSIPTTNMPTRRTPTRIRLRNTNQTIFRIGGCTQQVTISDMELLGNTALFGEAPRDSTGDYGIEGLGKWILKPQSLPNPSQIFTFENLTMQNFDKAIFVHNANDERCAPNGDQYCNQWQFDYVKVDHVSFASNKTGIYVDTQNTDWRVANSVFYYGVSNAPGDGIRIRHAGSMIIDHCFGGGYGFAEGIGGTFINIDSIGSLTVIASSAEQNRRSMYFNPAGAASSVMVNMIGNTFGDKIEIGGRINYISSGNFYGAKTIQADPKTTITSTGDHFCYDPTTFPKQCRDEAGRPVADPGFTNGRIMFQTGRLAEGAGDERINAKANHFGYDVEITDGLVQMDPNITFSTISAWANSPDRPRLQDGAMVYCKDCRRGPVCSQGTAGTDGAFAKRINGQWRCD